MSARTFDLQARQHSSSVLANFLAGRQGAVERAGIVPAVRNGTLTAVSSDNDAMRALFQPLGSSSGYAVTDSTAMMVSTVYACLSKLAGAVVQLPIHQYRVNNSGERERMSPTPLWWLLNEEPHDAWTSASWKDWIVKCWGLRGDQFTRIVRDTRASAGGAVTGLLPLHPDCVAVRRNGYRLAYDVYDVATGKQYSLDQDDMLHFPGFGFDGVRSMSVVQWAARNAVGNSLAAAEYMGRTIGDGAMPQIALTYPNSLNEKQAADLRASFVATYMVGPSARKLPLVLTQGGKVDPLSINPVDMELLASRRFEKEDICQAFGVPPVMIGENEKTSSWGTGVEQITLGFVRFTLAPMLCRWEEELNRKLFRRAGQFVEFSLDALLRGDSKAKAESFRAGLGGPGTGDGYYTVNEIRKLENMPPIEGGDQPYRAPRDPGPTGAPA